jgi:hypothetical protein
VSLQAGLLSLENFLKTYSLEYTRGDLEWPTHLVNCESFWGHRSQEWKKLFLHWSRRAVPAGDHILESGMPVTEVRWPEEAEELEANRKAHTEFACCKWAWNMYAAAANPWDLAWRMNSTKDLCTSCWWS